jgi:hypothetical protein
MQELLAGHLGTRSLSHQLRGSKAVTSFGADLTAVIQIPMVLSEDFTNILGNISDDLKQALSAEIAFLTQYVRAQDSTIFGESIQKRLRVTEVSLKQKDDEPKKPEVRAVVELDVTEGAVHSVVSCVI